MELEPKKYRGTLRLGVETDTWDITGSVMSRGSYTPMTTTALSRLFDEQQGERLLAPPVYSAIKHKGKPLYSYARKGEHVETAPRRTVIHTFRLLENLGTDLTFEMVCSRGTYVRSVVHDLGQKLGCGACLLTLRRLRCGRFTIERSVSLDAMEEILEAGRARDVLIPPEEVLGQLDTCHVEGDNAKRVGHGNPLREQAVEGMNFGLERIGEKILIMTEGRLIAIAEIRQDDAGFFLQPVRVLNRG